ncbi:MAG: hypothetical protein CML05_02970 [Pseudozobellia sp.]|nr:hypothetical protein [Pseudozobellia sp.]|tara:strand:- start:3125 stop:3649 length:525 start_codon:yes stop_codon:yes gene_type:complete
MNDFEKNINYYIDQYELEKQLYKKGHEYLQRGWLEKSEFLTICLWKSRRPKKLYNLNSEVEIKTATRLSFAEKDEIQKIKHLTKLHGVRIPTASAILSVTNPEKYPIIDKRCIDSLNDLGIIQWNVITESNWLQYLKVVRELGLKYNLPARNIEKGLFAYNRIKFDKQYRNLYK